LANVIVSGIPTVRRAIINAGKDGKTYQLDVEGYDLRAVMGINGVKGTHVTSNNIIEVFQTMGIEASRRTIVKEIVSTMEAHGLSVCLSVSLSFLLSLLPLSNFVDVLLIPHPHLTFSSYSVSFLALSSFRPLPCPVRFDYRSPSRRLTGRYHDLQRVLSLSPSLLLPFLYSFVLVPIFSHPCSAFVFFYFFSLFSPLFFR
jgi:hypothetical protein